MPDTAALTIVLDFLVAGLLMATLTYVWRFDRRLRQIRKGKDEFEKLLGDFARTTDRAAATMNQLKTAAGTTGRDLVTAIDHAAAVGAKQQQIAEDLKMLIGRGEAVADRLHDLVAKSRTLANANSAPPRAAALGANPDESAPEPQPSRHPALSAISGLR